MTPENLDKVLRAYRDRSPFRPFTIELVNGSRIEVNHPEAVTLRRDLIVYKSSHGMYGVVECSAVVRFLDATGTYPGGMLMMHVPIFDQLIREHLERTPFQPFMIEFDNGNRLVVQSRDALMAPSYGNTVYFGPNDALTFVDCVAVRQVAEAALAG